MLIEISNQDIAEVIGVVESRLDDAPEISIVEVKKFIYGSRHGIQERERLIADVFLDRIFRATE
jgi:hypothetical protein